MRMTRISEFVEGSKGSKELPRFQGNISSVFSVFQSSLCFKLPFTNPTVHLLWANF